MGRQVKRKVKRRNEGARPNGHPFDHSPIAPGTRCNFQVDDHSAHRILRRRCGRYQSGGDFSASIFNRFSRLDARCQGEFFHALQTAHGSKEWLAARGGQVSQCWLSRFRCPDGGGWPRRLREPPWSLARPCICRSRSALRWRHRFVSEIVGVPRGKHGVSPYTGVPASSSGITSVSR